MNAKYGKISIGCFIAIWPMVLILVLLSINFSGCRGGHPGILIIPWTLLCMLFGFIFGIVGAIKKETPKKYLIGIFLHLIIVLLLVIWYAWAWRLVFKG